MKKILTGLCFALLTSATLLITSNWKPVPGTKVNFTIDGMFGIDVKGTIGDLSTEISFFPDGVSRSSIKASIRPATIDTKKKKRDQHLATEDFFDVSRFPAIQFVSRSFRQIGEYYVVEGDLTIKDVTLPVTIPFEFIQQETSAVFRGDFTINRLDYHVGKRSWLIGNEVRVHLDIPVIPT